MILSAITDSYWKRWALLTNTVLTFRCNLAAGVYVQIGDDCVISLKIAMKPEMKI